MCILQCASRSPIYISIFNPLLPPSHATLGRSGILGGHTSPPSQAGTENIPNHMRKNGAVAWRQIRCKETSTPRMRAQENPSQIFDLLDKVFFFGFTLQCFSCKRIQRWPDSRSLSILTNTQRIYYLGFLVCIILYSSIISKWMPVFHIRVRDAHESGECKKSAYISPSLFLSTWLRTGSALEVVQYLSAVEVCSEPFR